MDKLHSGIRQVALIAASARDIALPSEIRTALLFSPHATEPYSILNGEQLGLFGQGIVVMPTGGPVWIRRSDFGDIVCHRWTAVTQTNSVTVTVLETFEQREMPDAVAGDDNAFAAQRVN